VHDLAVEADAGALACKWGADVDDLFGVVGQGSREGDHTASAGSWVADVRVGAVPAGEDEHGGHPGKRRWWPARASRA
jgi:hypothetical protein